MMLIWCVFFPTMIMYNADMNHEVASKNKQKEIKIKTEDKQKSDTAISAGHKMSNPW